MIFHSVGNVIIPTDEVIFFRGVGIPPTSIYRVSLLEPPFTVDFPRLIGGNAGWYNQQKIGESGGQ